VSQRGQLAVHLLVFTYYFLDRRKCYYKQLIVTRAIRCTAEIAETICGIPYNHKIVWNQGVLWLTTAMCVQYAHVIVVVNVFIIQESCAITKMTARRALYK